MWLEAILGLRINLSKSELIPVGRLENLEDLASVLGYAEESEVKIGIDSKGFPLGRRAFRRKPHLVNWVTVCANKKDEGLGVGNLNHSTRLFLARGWCSKEVSERYGVRLWKAIRKLWAMFITKVSFSVASSKGAWVADMWDQSLGSNGCWIPNFSRNLNDWEVDNVELLLLRLKDKKFGTLGFHLGCVSLLGRLHGLLFSLFGVSWVLSSSVRETLLAWHVSCVGRKQKKVWGAAPL
ncbi:hypothetical protein CK203_002293 [Vitis vinifera]|uniref:Uncharacterized protein n=1 Tax=Vitis vinifera TaxID=29760 RepID=A0A438KJ07_VITVI|nr:hypothetical protein CK203_002293 [Vitis vinifera]